MASCTNYYYSGQGVFYVAERNADGTPKAFRQLGNVPAAEISIDVTKFEHAEACSGQRAIDLTIIQEKNGTFTLTLESVNAVNLALAAWGDYAVVSGAAVASEALVIYDPAKRHVLANINVDETVPPTLAYDLATLGLIDKGAWAASTAYDVDDVVEDSQGRLQKCTVAGTSNDTEGEEFAVPTARGDATVETDAVEWVDIGKATLVLDTDFSVDYANGVVNVLNALDILADDPVVVGYTFLDYVNVDALTLTSQERWLRFEGLNTVDNKEVVVDIYKASFDPLQGYALINEEIAQIELNGNVLFDSLQPGDSKFFRQRYVSAAAG